MLKKISALFIIFSLIFCFAGCGEKQPEKNSLDLVPYLGGYKCDAENGYWKERLYGLMTTDGNVYVWVVFADKIEVYAAALNLIVKTENMHTN